jgi:hypothetical protein
MAIPLSTPLFLWYNAKSKDKKERSLTVLFTGVESNGGSKRKVKKLVASTFYSLFLSFSGKRGIQALLVLTTLISSTI